MTFVDYISILGTGISLFGFAITLKQLKDAKKTLDVVKDTLDKTGKTINYQEIFHLSSSLDEKMNDLKKIIEFKKYSFASEKIDIISTNFNFIIIALEPSEIKVEDNLLKNASSSIDKIRSNIEKLKLNPKLISEDFISLIESTSLEVAKTRDVLSQLKSCIHQVRHMK